MFVGQQNSFAELTKTIQTVNNQKFVFPASEITQAQDDVMSTTDVAKKF